MSTGPRAWTLTWAALLIATGCAHQIAMDELQKHEEPGYIYAYASGETPREAREQARAELASEISVHVSEHYERQVDAQRAAGEAEVDADSTVEHLTRTVTDIRLDGMEMVEVVEAGREWWAVARLSHEMRDKLRQQAAEEAPLQVRLRALEDIDSENLAERAAVALSGLEIARRMELEHRRTLVNGTTQTYETAFERVIEQARSPIKVLVTETEDTEPRLTLIHRDSYRPLAGIELEFNDERLSTDEDGHTRAVETDIEKGHSLMLASPQGEVEDISDSRRRLARIEAEWGGDRPVTVYAHVQPSGTVTTFAEPDTPRVPGGPAAVVVPGTVELERDAEIEAHIPSRGDKPEVDIEFDTPEKAPHYYFFHEMRKPRTGQIELDLPDNIETAQMRGPSGRYELEDNTVRREVPAGRYQLRLEGPEDERYTTLTDRFHLHEDDFFGREYHPLPERERHIEGSYSHGGLLVSSQVGPRFPNPLGGTMETVAEDLDDAVEADVSGPVDRPINWGFLGEGGMLLPSGWTFSVGAAYWFHSTGVISYKGDEQPQPKTIAGDGVEIAGGIGRWRPVGADHQWAIAASTGLVGGVVSWTDFGDERVRSSEGYFEPFVDFLLSRTNTTPKVTFRLRLMDPDFRAGLIQFTLGGADITDRGYQGHTRLGAQEGEHYEPISR